MAFHRSIKLPIDTEYFLSLYSGTEGGLATTAGIIAGLVIGTDDRGIVVTSALIALSIQAVNSMMTKFTIEHTTDEIERTDKKDGYKKPLFDAFAQFVAHFASGLIILLPIVLIQSLETALIAVVIVMLVMLFFTGLIKGRYVKRSSLRDALDSMIAGSIIVSFGMLVGLMFN